MPPPGHLGFFDLPHRSDARSTPGDPREHLAEPIPGAGFLKTLEKSLWRSTRLKGGRPAFEAGLMVTARVLHARYNFSDAHRDYQIRDRLAFLRFLGLERHQRSPDATTLWLLRETWAPAGVVRDALHAIWYVSGSPRVARAWRAPD